MSGRKLTVSLEYKMKSALLLSWVQLMPHCLRDRMHKEMHNNNIRDHNKKWNRQCPFINFLAHQFHSTSPHELFQKSQRAMGSNSILCVCVCVLETARWSGKKGEMNPADDKMTRRFFNRYSAVVGTHVPCEDWRKKSACVIMIRFGNFSLSSPSPFNNPSREITL